MFPGAPVPTTLRERLGALVRLVAGYVGDRTRPGPVHVRGPGLIPPAFCTLVQEWLFARQRAMSELIWRMETGRWRPPPVRAPRQRAADAARVSPARTHCAPERLLPRGLGWLCRWAPEVRRAGMQIAAVLNEPETREKVLAAPGQFARLIGPILTATGERKPDWFPKGPKRTKRNAASTPMRLSHAREAGARPVSMWAAPPWSDPPPPPICPPPPPPRPRMAAWTGRGPGPCASLEQYRSPFEPPIGIVVTKMR